LGTNVVAISWARSSTPRAFSYFTADPKACANCHIMNSEYDSWVKSSHHMVAGCVDCHLPHTLVPKLVAKGVNGHDHGAGLAGSSCTLSM
jgi:cytochrome c nitrite reductase small subunit